MENSIQRLWSNGMAMRGDFSVTDDLKSAVAEVVGVCGDKEEGVTVHSDRVWVGLLEQFPGSTNHHRGLEQSSIAIGRSTANRNKLRVDLI